MNQFFNIFQTKSQIDCIGRIKCANSLCRNKAFLFLRESNSYVQLWRQKNESGDREGESSIKMKRQVLAGSSVCPPRSHFRLFFCCFCSLRLCFHLWLSRAESTVASGSSSTGAAGPDTFEPGLLSSVAWTENDKCLVFIEKQFLFVSRETQIVPFLLEICLISRRASNKTIQPPARLTVCPDCKT